MIFSFERKNEKVFSFSIAHLKQAPPLIITASNKRCTSLFQNLIGARERLKEEYDNCGS